MKLKYAAAHLSITSFPEVELPDFTLITGLNGAGKSHLLNAIAQAKIKVDIAPDPKSEIRLFDWTNLIPNEAGIARNAELYSDRDQILQWIEQIRQTLQHELMGAVEHVGGLRIPSPNLWELAGKPAELLMRDIVDPARAQELYGAIAHIAEKGRAQFRQLSRKHAGLLKKTEEVCITQRCHILALESIAFEPKPFEWGEVDLFRQSFAQMFLAYFELVKLNKLHQLDALEGLAGPEALTDDEFVSVHGEPPWDFVNATLQNAGLDFTVDHPIGYSTTSFTPRLTKTSSGAQIPFSALSSGEKVLMSFALCMYYSLDTRQSVKRPALLLFDEIDAPLHPSMCRTVVAAIKNTLVSKYGVKVIMATHSPSTVAVADEGAIYAMSSSASGLKKVGKRQAITLLTADIPTLSMTFDGRRQVFVESYSDAERFDTLYRHVSPRIASERSLVFIGVGRRKPLEADDAAGCDQVKRTVQALANGGNESVFGLVDWDKRNDPEGRVHVLGHGKRYAIENYLLDPLLVAAISIREKRVFGTSIVT